MDIPSAGEEGGGDDFRSAVRAPINGKISDVSGIGKIPGIFLLVPDVL